jgi:hypothetical protein
MMLQFILEVQLPTDFITAQSLATFGGASIAVWILSNLVRVMLKTTSAIPCFIISLIVAAIASHLLHTLNGVVSYFLVLLNGALLFFTAIGMQGFTGAAAKGEATGETKLQAKTEVKFLTPWF